MNEVCEYTSGSSLAIVSSLLSHVRHSDERVVL